MRVQAQSRGMSNVLNVESVAKQLIRTRVAANISVALAVCNHAAREVAKADSCRFQIRKVDETDSACAYRPELGGKANKWCGIVRPEFRLERARSCRKAWRARNPNHVEVSAGVHRDTKGLRSVPHRAIWIARRNRPAHARTAS